MEYNPDAQEDLGNGGRSKNWLQDNIRIIFSVLIVLAIAGGIYSYSNRSEGPINEEIASQETAEEATEQKNENDAVTIIGETEEKEQEQEKKDQQVTSEQQQQPKQEKQPEPEKKEDVKINGGANTQQKVTSEETGEGFIETAAGGDSKTTLARKAVRDYLEKNNDSSLTKEHKIYIEDYLQKRLDHPNKISVGEKVTFSKTMIKDAIEKSKSLNENQLKHLKKFSARVSTI